VLIEDYSQLMELVMARGLIADEMMDPREGGEMPPGMKGLEDLERQLKMK
jgi:hypothetical protein